MLKLVVPQKNSIKIYYENGFYHIYNRGVEKRDIFLDEQDYAFFLHIIKGALLPEDKDQTEPYVSRPRRKNFFGKIDLMCYALLPNHFHLLLKQNAVSSATDFMRSICTSYSMWFNKKYKRVGSLFQGVFKATNINNENYLLWVSRYIHRNPPNFTSHSYSSYQDYLPTKNTLWVNKSFILNIFSQQTIKQVQNYQSFVENEPANEIDLENLTLESEEE